MNKTAKYLLYVIVLLSISLTFTSFSKNKTKTIQGYVHVYGNDPFAFIGIETADEKIYAISASEEEISKLWKSQGKPVEITGIIIPSNNQRLPDMLKDGKIEVSDWKFVK